MTPGPIARLPIGVKLPLTAGVFVLAVGLVLSTASTVAVRQATMASARDRLTPLSEQLAATFRTGVGQVRERIQATARDPALAKFLMDSNSVDRRRVLEALRPTAPQDSGVLANELRDPAGRVVLSVGLDPGVIARSTRHEWLPAPDEHPDSIGLGGFHAINDSLVTLAVVAPVPAVPGARVVQWRRASRTPAVQQQVSRIIGSEGRILFGNADGTFWSDFIDTVPAPPVPPGELLGLLTYTRPGQEEVLASVVPIAGTPWVFAVEFPTRAVLAPVTSFIRSMAAIAILSLSLGLIVTWMLSRRITAPLQQLTHSADAIAGGDYTRRVGLERADELGRLAASFDSMAAQVEDAQGRLEVKVAARTAELNAALVRLQDAQQALARREKLALLGQLASGVGHELRNPLGVMSNAVYYLDAVQRDAPDDVRKFLGILREQIALSAKIVNDLLDFSRVTPVERIPIAVEHIADTQLRRLEPADAIAVTKDFPEDLPLVHVDPVHAGQIVLNVLTNAVEAMGPGGTLHLAGRRGVDGTVRLEITDSGPGIPPEHLDKVFEPLFTTKSTGIGLGLAVSKSLAQANGGDLMLVSRPGPGTTFAFEMPTAQRA